MPAPGGGFEQSYNAQAAVDTNTMLVIAPTITQAANDKQQLAPMLDALSELPDDLGSVTQLLADAGYFSEANVTACIDAAIDPLLAMGRESHHLPWQERFAAAGRAGRRGGAHEASTEDPCRACGVGAAQADRGTGVRYHQGPDGVPAVSPAWA